MSSPTKAIMTVADVSRLLNLSRSRFYQLIGTAFPWPVYCIKTRRPVYVEEMQKVCLEVRRRNCGIDGKPILFYSRRLPNTTTPSPKPKPKPKPSGARVPQELIDGVRALGLTVSATQITAVVNQLYPFGVTGDFGDVIRNVFLYIKRQNSSDNVGR
jgi:hypothetical protein